MGRITSSLVSPGCQVGTQQGHLNSSQPVLSPQVATWGYRTLEMFLAQTEIFCKCKTCAGFQSLSMKMERKTSH